jgi:hypothetical protein
MMISQSDHEALIENHSEFIISNNSGDENGNQSPEYIIEQGIPEFPAKCIICKKNILMIDFLPNHFEKYYCMQCHVYFLFRPLEESK